MPYPEVLIQKTTENEDLLLRNVEEHYSSPIVLFSIKLIVWILYRFFIKKLPTQKKRTFFLKFLGILMLLWFEENIPKLVIKNLHQKETFKKIILKSIWFVIYIVHC